MALAILSASGVAAADDARAAYERGAAAFGRREYADAAREFAKADQLSPNQTALSSALTAATSADDPVLGMELVERAEARSPALKKSASVQAARQKFQARAGKLRVDCAEKHACTAKLDGAELVVGVERWTATGAHRVEITPNEGLVASYDVTVTAAATLSFRAPVPTAAPPPAPPTTAIPSAEPPTTASTVAPLPPSTAPLAPTDAHVRPPVILPQRSEKPLPPVVFFLGLALTAGAGAATIASGVDALNKHSQWDDTGDAGVNKAGRDAQTRTNVLVAATAVAGVATLGLGLFAVRWSSPNAELSARVGPGGVSALARF